MAAAVDEERRAGGALAGVVEPLEEGLDLGAEVGQVHVVDEVVEGAEDADRAGRVERGAVLDVAPLEPVVPVHAADPVAVGADAGDHLGAGDGRHRGEAGDAVGDQHAALEQGAEGRRALLGDGPFEHVGAQRVDVGEDQLLLGGHLAANDARPGRRASAARAARRVCAGRGGGGRSRARPGRAGSGSPGSAGTRRSTTTISAASATRKPSAPPRPPSRRPAPATRSLITMQAAIAPSRPSSAPERPVDQEAGDQADHRGEQGHAAAGRAVRAGGAGQHADRDADPQVGEKVHMRKPNRPGPLCVDPAHLSA